MTLLPTIHGVIDRRMLVNYRADPEVVARQLPAPFRPKLAGGKAIVGICLIRLREIRAGCVPRAFGMSSENAAHRIAIEWDDETGQRREGVYIPRRDTDSIANVLAGGRLFSGPHHHAKFDVRETDERYEIALASNDDEVVVRVIAKVAPAIPATSIFPTLADASTFFEGGSLGYSAREKPGTLDGIELRCQSWDVTPMTIERLQSSYFDDEQRFPRGSIEPDCALLMRNIEHEWKMRDPLYCGESLAPSPGQGEGWGEGRSARSSKKRAYAQTPHPTSPRVQGEG